MKTRHYRLNILGRESAESELYFQGIDISMRILETLVRGLGYGRSVRWISLGKGPSYRSQTFENEGGLPAIIEANETQFKSPLANSFLTVVSEESMYRQIVEGLQSQLLPKDHIEITSDDKIDDTRDIRGITFD